MGKKKKCQMSKNTKQVLELKLIQFLKTKSKQTVKCYPLKITKENKAIKSRY